MLKSGSFWGHRGKIVSALSAAILIVSSLVATPASAATEKKPEISYSAALEPCVQKAIKSKAKKWVCEPEGLNINVDSKGVQVNEFIEVPTKQILLGSVAQPAKGGSHEDTWCENGASCKRKINDYIYEVKRNAVYGSGSKTIGQYDLVVRTYLNGRQAQWTVTRVWDSGPSLNFTDSKLTCLEKRGALSPNICGTHKLSSVTINSGVPRTQKKIYGNYLKNSNNYYGMFRTKFTPRGYSQYTAAGFDTGTFNCYGNADDRCYVP